MGVVRGPREVDPAIRSESWVAWARGSPGERVDGEGDTPDGALRNFVKKMRASGQAFSVEVRIGRMRKIALGVLIVLIALLVVLTLMSIGSVSPVP